MTEYTINNTYELAYLLLPTLTEDEAAKVAEGFQAAVTKAGAQEILSVGAPSFIDLEYPMTKRIDTKNQKFEQGYFGWVKFNAVSTTPEALKEELDQVTEMLRYMTVKTEGDNELTEVFSVEGAVESEEAILAEVEEETEEEQEKAAVEASEASGEGEKKEEVEAPTEEKESAEEAKEEEKQEVEAEVAEEDTKKEEEKEVKE